MPSPTRNPTRKFPPTQKDSFSQKLPQTHPLIQKLSVSTSPLKIYAIILTVALISGVASGYVLAASKPGSSTPLPDQTGGPATHAQQDTRTFHDFAEGVIQKKPDTNSDYSEGTHLLIRQNAVPVDLTSSVVDLTQYEGKKVKVFGQTQAGIKVPWLMDVGRVEVE